MRRPCEEAGRRLSLASPLGHGSSMTPKPPDTLEHIESKIAFLERANTELSDVVFRQQRELAALREQLTALATRLDSTQPEATKYSLEDERPPHY